MSEFAALCADLGRTFTDEELAATLATKNSQVKEQIDLLRDLLCDVRTSS